MNILVTGGAGFIGYHLCKKLSENHSVTVIDRKIGIEIGSMDMYKHIVVGEYDAIFHLAANSDIKNSNEFIEHRDTFSTTQTMLNVCRDFGIKQFIFASSSAVFGEVNGLIKEGTKHRPISHYGAAKSASEAYINAYANKYFIQSWILRFPNVVGSHATHGVILDLLKKHKENPDNLEVLGDGNQCKPYMHISDLINAIWIIYQNMTKPVNVINISTIGNVYVSQIAELITRGKITFTGGTAWNGDVESYYFSRKKLENIRYFADYSSIEAVQLAIEEIRKEI
jgi:UDP-glucose 4-epimerase